MSATYPNKNDVRGQLFNTFSAALAAAWQFHRKRIIGDIEEGHPWHVLFKFADCKLFSFSVAALFRNRNFRSECRFFAGGLALDHALVIEENDDFIKQQSWARDNVTMFSGHKVVSNCHFTIFVVATPSRH